MYRTSSILGQRSRDMDGWRMEDGGYFDKDEVVG